MLHMQLLYFPQYDFPLYRTLASDKWYLVPNGTQECYHTLGIHFHQHCSTIAAHPDPKTSTSPHTSFPPLFHFVGTTTTRHPMIQGSCPPESFLKHIA